MVQLQPNWHGARVLHLLIVHAELGHSAWSKARAGGRARASWGTVHMEQGQSWGQD